jgi:hypothetical protein
VEVEAVAVEEAEAAEEADEAAVEEVAEEVEVDHLVVEEAAEEVEVDHLVVGEEEVGVAVDIKDYPVAYVYLVLIISVISCTCTTTPYVIEPDPYREKLSRPKSEHAHVSIWPFGKRKRLLVRYRYCRENSVLVHRTDTTSFGSEFRCINTVGPTM